MPARTRIFTRILPVAAIAAGLLVAAPGRGREGQEEGQAGDREDRARRQARPRQGPGASAEEAEGQDLAGPDHVPEHGRAADRRQRRRWSAPRSSACTTRSARRTTCRCCKENAKLRKAAVGHSTAMVNEGYFDHTSPDGDSFVDRIIGAGYAKRNDGWTLGENLAWGTGDLSTATGVMNAWMNSAGHKANILKKAYKEVGIGIRLGVPSDEGVGATITADFGVKLCRPAS